MALTRKFLSALGIEADKIDEIISAHSDTVNALKGERDEYKVDAEKYESTSKKLAKIEKELSELKDSQANSSEEWETKYTELKSKYDSYKKDVEAKATKQSKIDAYKKLLKEANVSDKRFDSIVKISSELIDGIEFDDDNKVKNRDKLLETIKGEWADFIVTTSQKGADTATPPANDTGKPKTKSRAAQLAEKYHNELYGEAKSKEE